MEPYRQVYKILSSDADCLRRLRLSRLFTLLQEAAIAHTEALGFGRERTLDRGFLWVVLTQQVKVRRLPLYDETVLLESVPGEMMHTIYPRYYRMTDSEGRELLTAAALWTLMDRTRRTMASPKDTGVDIPAQAAAWETFYPRHPKLPGGEDRLTYTVPYSATDLNGHMNNARYLDLAEDLMRPALRMADVREIQAEYAAEARLGDVLTLQRQEGETSFLLAGTGEKRAFRLGLIYEQIGDDRVEH